MAQFTLSLRSDDPKKIASALRKAASEIEGGKLRLNRSYTLNLNGSLLGWYRQSSYKTRRTGTQPELDKALTTLAGMDEALCEIASRDRGE